MNTFKTSYLLVLLYAVSGQAKLFNGDLKGSPSNTIVTAVGGVSAQKIAQAASISSAGTASDTPNTVVMRDNNGDFATHMITLDGTPSNATDATTKQYVDLQASAGLQIKSPALVVGQANVALSGLQTIDGVTLADGNTVLLIAQTTASQNGLWTAHTGAWERAPDFQAGTVAGKAYVLITSGNTQAGSSWVCTTPDVIIDAGSLTFSQFGLASTTATNVGDGAGQVFQSKTDNTLNLRTIKAGAHITVTNNTNDITLSTDATTAATANTIVLRNGSGNFGGNASGFTGILGVADITDVYGTQADPQVQWVGGATADQVGAAGILVASGGTIGGPISISDPLRSAAIDEDYAVKKGLVTKSPPTGTPLLNYALDTSTGVGFPAVGQVSLITDGIEALVIDSSGVVKVDNLAGTAGVVHNDSSGNLSSSLIVNADISSSAAIADTKLATISTAGKVSNSATTATSANTANAIVARDSSGNISVGTMTGSVTGAASSNVLKAGDTMSGALVLPAGSSGVPSLQFSGSSNTGLSASTANQLDITANGTRAMTATSSAVTAAANLVVSKLLCNQGVQVFPLTNGNAETINVNNDTSILLLTDTGSTDSGLKSIGFPLSPVDGQFLTIAMLSSTDILVSIGLGGGQSIVGNVTAITPNTAMVNNSAVTAVTYYYNSANTTWVRYSRS